MSEQPSYASLDADLEAELRDRLIAAVEASQAPTEQLRAYVAERFRQDLMSDVVKGGPIMAYREQLRQEACGAVLDLPNIDLSDVDRLSVVKSAVDRWISCERFVQDLLSDIEEDAPEGVGDDPAD